MKQGRDGFEFGLVLLYISYLKILKNTGNQLFITKALINNFRKKEVFRQSDGLCMSSGKNNTRFWVNHKNTKKAQTLGFALS